MAIEFFTGFEGCASDADVRALIDGSDGASVLKNAGAFQGGNGIAGPWSVNNWCFKKNTTASRYKAIGCHISGASSTTDANRYLFWFVGPDIRINNVSDGIRVYVGGSLLYFAEGYGVTSTLSHVEAEVYSHPTLGTVKIKINGTLICDLSGVNTGDADITEVWWGSTSTNPVYDNIYVADVLQGELYSLVLRPTTDASVQFTPLSGTDNFAMLQLNNGDTSYVQSDTIGYKDLYGYEDLPVNLIPLSATVVTVARKEGTGERAIQTISKQDLTEYNDSDPITLTTAYSSPNIAKTRGLAPDGTAWTRDKINAMQWGFKVAG